MCEVRLLVASFGEEKEVRISPCCCRVLAFIARDVYERHSSACC